MLGEIVVGVNSPSDTCDVCGVALGLMPAKVRQLMALHAGQCKIALRRTEGPVVGCIGFHCDGMYATQTVQLTLNADSEYEGGRLCFYTRDGGLSIPERPAGTLTRHDRKVLHGVTRLHRGVRYSLFVVDVCNVLDYKDVHKLGRIKAHEIARTIPSPRPAAAGFSFVADIPFGDIAMTGVIGAGAVKTVHRGTWTGKAGTPVAILELETASLDVELAIADQIRRHRHLMTIFGCASHMNKSYLVAELAPLGGLRDYLLQLEDDD